MGEHLEPKGVSLTNSSVSSIQTAHARACTIFVKEINETKYLIGNYGLKDEMFFGFFINAQIPLPPQSAGMKFCSINLVLPPSHMGPRGWGLQGDVNDKQYEDPPPCLTQEPS